MYVKSAWAQEFKIIQPLNFIRHFYDCAIFCCWNLLFEICWTLKVLCTSFAWMTPVLEKPWRTFFYSYSSFFALILFLFGLQAKSITSKILDSSKNLCFLKLRFSALLDVYLEFFLHSTTSKCFTDS